MLRGLSGPAARRWLSTAPVEVGSITHHELRSAVRSFVETEINPHVDKWESDGIFPAKSLFKKMGDAGLLGVNKPVEFGGLGLDFTYALAVAEELGHIQCGGIPMAIGVQTDMATPALARFGSDEVRRQFLEPSISGDFVACLGVSEAGAGSDVAGIRTVARREGDEYIIDGSKMWTTNGTQADWMCLLANTEGGQAPHRNKTMIAVPMDLPGISIAPRFDKVGMRSSDTTQVFFDRVRVPASNLIGEEGKGFVYQMVQFQEERLFAAANMLMPLERCIAQVRRPNTGRRRSRHAPATLPPRSAHAHGLGQLFLSHRCIARCARRRRNTRGSARHSVGL